MCIEGTFEIRYENVSYQYKKGDTVLIPAGMRNYVLEGEASILEVYIS